MSGNFSRDASLFCSLFNKVHPCPRPSLKFGARRPTQNSLARSLLAPALPSLGYHALPGPSVSMLWGALLAPIPLIWASLRVPPERQEAKQPPSPEVGGGSLCLGDAPHPTSEDPGRADRSIYLPLCLLPARSAARAAQFPPWRPGLVLTEALLWGCPSFFFAPAPFPRASQSLVFPLELALRLRSSSRLGPGRMRPAPHSTPPRGSPARFLSVAEDAR